ncbi:MAG TPA: helix-turn-helix transcriptional regulator [Candidatus Limnocylindrales bacterium]|nr:helix-turn-helix transcriptional regulator [Candidatus Limnocylindrales bacterium]
MLRKDASGKVDSGRTTSTQQSIVELATELRALREKSHRSLRELQHATFASDSSLSRYLSGRTVPPWQVVEALCRLGDRDPAELRDLWERARQARGKQSRAARISSVPDASAETVPTRDIPPRDAIITACGQIGYHPARTVLGLLVAAAAGGLVTAFVWRWRPATRWRS